MDGSYWLIYSELIKWRYNIMCVYLSLNNTKQFIEFKASLIYNTIVDNIRKTLISKNDEELILKINNAKLLKNDYDTREPSSAGLH